MTRLPSVAAVMALEAVSTFGSLRAAAESLSVTESAVSHRITALEHHYGVRILDRKSRPVTMTAEGQRLLQHLGAALTHLRMAEATRDGPPHNGLTISALPSIAQRWLLPRLAAFMALHTSLDLKLMTSLASDDFVAEGVDVGLRFGTGDWKGVSVELLSGEMLYPVTSPAALDAVKLPRSADPKSVFAQLPLLRDPWQPWSAWLEQAGLNGSTARYGPFIEDPVLLLQAAELGQGVVLARSRLVQDAIAAGRLMRLSQTEVPASGKYFAVFPQGRRRSKAARNFLDWLRCELTHNRQ